MLQMRVNCHILEADYTWAVSGGDFGVSRHLRKLLGPGRAAEAGRGVGQAARKQEAPKTIHSSPKTG